MGYTSEAPNWSIKQILYGKQGIPLFRLEKLCKFMSVSLVDIERYIVKFCSPKD
jgi:DNA-binding Xre family transcriptional regulator